LAAAQADLVALRVARQRGELLNVGEVERKWSGILTGVRSGVLAAPSRIGARLPHLSADDVGMIDAELRAVLTDVAHDGG